MSRVSTEMDFELESSRDTWLWRHVSDFSWIGIIIFPFEVHIFRVYTFSMILLFFRIWFCNNVIDSFEMRLQNLMSMNNDSHIRIPKISHSDLSSVLFQNLRTYLVRSVKEYVSRSLRTWHINDISLFKNDYEMLILLMPMTTLKGTCFWYVDPNVYIGTANHSDFIIPRT